MRFPELAWLMSAVVLAGCGESARMDDAAAPSPGGSAEFPGVPFAPAPDADEFYAQPRPLPDVAPGTVLKSRGITFSPGGVPQPNPAWLIQYMTRDVNGLPLAATAAVVKPLLPALLYDTPLLSYQFAYDSLGAECSPTHTITGSSANANAMLETAAYLPGLTGLGWTMVFPDYEGPYHAYGAGKLSGQATLDGIRAALSFEPLGLKPETQVGIWGYSGGALATSWAASLQPVYAPELNVVAVASGGTPADVFGIVQHAENGPFFGLIFSAVVGTNRAYPELIPDSIITAEGRRVINGIKDGCIGADTDGSGGASGSLAQYTTLSDPFNSPGALAVKPKVTLPQPGLTPRANMYIYHETLDELIPVAGTTAMVESWCADGAQLSYFRSLSGEHIAGAVSGAPFAMAYLAGRFAGSPVDVAPPTAMSCNK